METTFNFNLQDEPRESLEKIKKEIEKEISRRREMEKIKLVENFRTAFMALLSAGIEVRCADCDDEIDFGVYHWDNFYFN